LKIIEFEISPVPKESFGQKHKKHKKHKKHEEKELQRKYLCTEHVEV